MKSLTIDDVEAGTPSEILSDSSALRYHVATDAWVNPTFSGYASARSLVVSKPLLDEVHRSKGSFGDTNVIVGTSRFAIVDMLRSGAVLESGVSLAGRASWNFFHQSIEILPRLFFLKQLSGSADLPLLVPPSILSSGAAHSLLRLLAPSSEVIELPSGWTRIHRAILLPNLYELSLQSETVVSFQRDAFLAYRKLVLSRLGIKPNIVPGRRLHIVRGSRSRSMNERNLLEVSERFGFVPWHPEGHDLEEQIAAWSTAEVVLGDSGAAWSNLHFSPRGSKALMLTFAPASRYEFWQPLASIGGRDLHFLPSAGVPDGLRGGSGCVDPEVLKAALRRLCPH